MDLGGGSGRLAERVLERFAGARVTIVDQSEPFLALAERRLAHSRRVRRLFSAGCKIGPHVDDVSPRREDRVSERLDHVDAQRHRQHIGHSPFRPGWKSKRCSQVLCRTGARRHVHQRRRISAGGRCRVTWRLFQEWSAHMGAAIADGRIPEDFRATLDYWHDRNIRRFDEPKKSGDDCTETVAAQIAQLCEIGFAEVEPFWVTGLWAVVIANKHLAR